LDLWILRLLHLLMVLLMMTSAVMMDLLHLLMVLHHQLLAEEGELLPPLARAFCLCVEVSLTLREEGSKVERGEGVLVLDVWVWCLVLELRVEI
jgi:hypothetical protein